MCRGADDPWAPTASHVCGALWSLGFYEAARLRPVLVTEDELVVRTSLLWTARVPRAAITGVRALCAAPDDDGALRAALFTAPNALVTLSAGVKAYGLFGRQRAVRAIALYVDSPASFTAALDPISAL